MFNIENTWEWASNYGHSFRTHDDIYNDWKSIVEILNVHATVVSKSGPGKWADPGKRMILFAANTRINDYFIQSSYLGRYARGKINPC